MAKVAIVKGHDLDNAVDYGLSLLGGMEQYIHEQDNVLIKPNLCCGKPWSTGATTDPLLTEKVIQRVKEITDKITIGEADHSTINSEYTFGCLGYKDMARRNNIRLINLSDKSKIVTLKNPDGFILKEVQLHEEVLKADLVINLPVMKTNEISEITLSLKNIFGAIPTREKARFHNDIHKVIADVNRFIGKSLIILDARCAMEGNGPIDGELLHLNTLVFGDNAVAVDYIGAQIMGFNPLEIEHIALSEACGIGKTNDIQLLGFPLREAVHPFKRAKKISKEQAFKYTLLKNKYFTALAGFIANRIR